MYDIPVVFHFKVEFGAASSDQDNRFQEVAGLSAEVATEEFREGGLNEYAHRVPTGAKYGNLVLKRGFIKDSDVGKWFRAAIENFAFEPKDITVTLLNEEHEPLASWSFIGAYPVKWSLSDFKAQENALAVESLELTYRSFRKG
ncbi:MAG: phage tail protein [Acidobacteria bacterium]|nr:MAG: phage tail protein [Acidobacteriota bacterium]